MLFQCLSWAGRLMVHWQPVGWAGMGQGPRKPMGFMVAHGTLRLLPDSKFLP